MYQVRAKGSGTFDKGTKTWRLQGKGIHATAKQLERRYNVTFTQTEPEGLKAASKTYWRRYLQDAEDDRAEAEKDAKASSAFATLRSRLSATIRPLAAR